MKHFLQISTFCSIFFFPWQGGRRQELPPSCDGTLFEQSGEIPQVLIAEAQALTNIAGGPCPLAANSCRQLSAGRDRKTRNICYADVRLREQVAEKGVTKVALRG